MVTEAVDGGAEDLRVPVAADARELTRAGIFQSSSVLAVLLYI